jgi:uncharacterized protein
MVAIDTNILVYARRVETPNHKPAYRLLESLALGDDPWFLPWPCIYEYLRVVTHPRVFTPPTPLDAAIEDLGKLFQSPSLRMGGESRQHWNESARMPRSSRASGNLVHDAHIATLLIEHGVREFFTDDRDFGRFPGLKITHPFG